jgi:C4-dicarboxylate-specific signal transduction histidine kinase
MARQNKLATLGMMAASPSHEINNALSAAQLQLELARKKADQEDEI